jgi:hypothetical protein
LWPKSIADEVEGKLLKRMQDLGVGDPVEDEEDRCGRGAVLTRHYLKCTPSVSLPRSPQVVRVDI